MTSPVVVHVPHASPLVPDAVRRELLVDDDALRLELAAMTDWLTDDLARRAVAVLPAHVPPPHLWVNPWSRLVVDPERFPDERESMTAVGMGAVYTSRHDGSPLRAAGEHAALLERFFTPYAEGLTDLVQRVLDEHGRVVVVDLHSFPSAALPYELAAHGPRARPELCVGTDACHTPAALAEAVVDAWPGEVARDEPFAGTYVPLRFHGTDPRVTSVMIELRRDQVDARFDDPARLVRSGALGERPWSEAPAGRPSDRVVRFLAEVVERVTRLE